MTENTQTADALEHANGLALKHLSWRDVFDIQGDLPADDEAALEAYLRAFTFREGNLCPGCDSPLTGDLMSSFLGSSTFEWGLTHGEGHCRKCFYPARGYHRNFGPVKFLSMVLPYHPDVLRRQSEEAEAS